MENNKYPYILKETGDYAVVYKPPKMHSRDKSSGNREQKTEDKLDAALLDWYAGNSPPVFDIMHRLDYETHGLVLFAKNEKSYLFFKSLQDKGGFVKEYSAVVIKDSSGTDTMTGFPEYNDQTGSRETPFVIESYFRPYGPGRKLVRPVVGIPKKHKETAKDKGGFYKTEIINMDGNAITAQIRRGFRHQIRCHLCWIGLPILNDPIYPAPPDVLPVDILALRAHALFFTDPADGEYREYRIPPLHSCSEQRC